jgi:hypothetical protein
MIHPYPDECNQDTPVKWSRPTNSPCPLPLSSSPCATVNDESIGKGYHKYLQPTVGLEKESIKDGTHCHKLSQLQRSGQKRKV